MVPESLNGEGVQVGYGVVDQLAGFLDGPRRERIFLVAQEPGFSLSGAKERLRSLLGTRTMRSFTEFAPNPQWEDAVRGAAELRAFRADVLVAVGGGSVLDMAKLINALGGADEPNPDLLRAATWDFGHRIPWVAVPTTSGTGAEATGFAVVYFEGSKFSLSHADLRPDLALVDPTFTLSAPPALTSATGLDALCQGIESWWSVHATSESRRFARAATSWAWGALPAAVGSPDRESRLWMARAAHVAGRAIHVSKTTAPHALSYRISSKYGVPHGWAVALNLAPILAYNAASPDTEVADTMRSIMGTLGFRDAKDAESGFIEFLVRLKAPHRLSLVGIHGEEALEDLIASVNAQRLANNPRPLEAPILRDLLRRVA